MEKCNVIPVILAFSRKKAFNYERAELELRKKGELRTVSFFVSYFKWILFEIDLFLILKVPYFIDIQISIDSNSN